VGVRALRSIFILALLGVLLVPSPAAAQKCRDDDIAAIDQYCELLPTAAGPVAADTPQPRLRQTLAPAERLQLRRAGPAGRALLSMPEGVGLHVRGHTPQLLPGAAAVVARWMVDHGDRRDTSLGATTKAAWHGARLSELFRWLLLMSTVGLVGTAWVQRRR
jgi:hypothetical protein